MWTKAEIDKMVDSGEGLSPEMRQLFKEHPEKKEAYKAKLYDSQGGGGCQKVRATACKTCKFVDVIDPIGKQPQTPYCEIYPLGGEQKPADVLYEGADCDYYEPDDE